MALGDNIRNAASKTRTTVGNAADRAQNVRAVGGLVDFSRSLTDAYKSLFQGTFNKNNAAAGVGFGKIVGRGIGSAGSVASGVVGMGFRGLASIVRFAPPLAAIGATVLGVTLFNAWRRDRAARAAMEEQANVPPQMQNPYVGGATSAELDGPTGENVGKFAPQGQTRAGERTYAPDNGMRH